MADARRVARRYLTRKADTAPLPAAFPPSEIGLMTVREFLKFRNPDEKHHSAELWDYDIAKLNPTLSEVWHQSIGGHEFTVLTPFGGGEGHAIRQDGDIVGVVKDGTLFHTNKARLNLIPRAYGRGGGGGETVDLGIRRERVVKYIGDALPLVSHVAARNRKEYGHLLQNIIVAGEPLQVRAEKPPVTDKGTSLAILNARGEVVARATDEWGAVLLTVAREHRGKGLGRVIGEHWYRWNPSYKSGGFTQAGESNAIRIWDARVGEFLARGWYSELVKRKRLTKARVDEILHGFLRGKQAPRSPRPPEPEARKGEVLVRVEYPTFVVYDSRFLDEQDEGHLLGYGFFRDAPRVGAFLYTIDYDRSHRKLVTSVAMQMARDEGERVYVGEGYGDIIELEGIPGVEREGDYAFLTRDVLPLRAMAAKERVARRKVDPHGEIGTLLLEMAESKWS